MLHFTYLSKTFRKFYGERGNRDKDLFIRVTGQGRKELTARRERGIQVFEARKAVLGTYF